MQYKESTAKLNLAYLYQNQVAKEIIINENFAKLDAIICKLCLDIVEDLTPLLPNESDVYILNVTNNTPQYLVQNKNNIALFLNGGWIYIAPIDGMEYYILSKQKKYIYSNQIWQETTIANNNQTNLILTDLINNNIPAVDKVYSSQKSENVFAKKTDIDIMIATLAQKTDVYNKTQVYNKTEIYNKIEIDLTINSLASQATTYSKTDVDTKLQILAVQNNVFSIANLFNEITTIANKKTALANIFSSVDYNFIKTLLQIPDVAAASSGNITGDYKYSVQNTDHSAWLVCNGKAISRTTYSALFALIGTSFGIGDGSTTFNLPDFRGRVTGGIGSGAGLTNRTIGQNIGEENHILTTNEMPSHSHTMGPAGGVVNDQGGNAGAGAGANRSVSYTTGNTGGNASHNNMQPTLFAGHWFIFIG